MYYVATADLRLHRCLSILVGSNFKFAQSSVGGVVVAAEIQQNVLCSSKSNQHVEGTDRYRELGTDAVLLFGWPTSGADHPPVYEY